MTADLAELLADIREFLADQAEAEYFTDRAAPVPNKAMALMASLDEIVGDPQAVTVTQASGYVVVSHWTVKMPGRTVYETVYDHAESLNDAADRYTEIVDGEFARATAIGIFPVGVNGMPIDKPIDAHTLTKLVRETRSA